MKQKTRLLESIDRFRRGFWQKETIDRPPVAIVPEDMFMPIKFLRRELSCRYIQPEHVTEALYMSDYEFTSFRAVQSDDWIPFSAAWRAIPWLEAICGCAVRNSHGSLAAQSCIDSTTGLRDIEMRANNTWLECLKQQTEQLATTMPQDCWVSPTILRGPSDVLAAMCGLTEFYCRIADDISLLDEAVAQVNNILLNVLDVHFSIIPPKHNGYGHIYGYWAPDKTVVIQEDVLGMCSPDVYTDIFMRYNTAIVEHLGKCVLFHLHSTGYQAYKHVLKIPNIAGIEITVEANGPSLFDMVPLLKDITQNFRLILFVNHYFEQLSEVLNQLPKEGVYLIILDKYIDSENKFNEFVSDIW